MSIYGKLGFNDNEVEYMLNHIRNVLYEGDSKSEKDMLDGYFKSADRLIKQLDETLSVEVPDFYKSHIVVVSEQLKVARQALLSLPAVNFHIPMKRLPKRNIQRLNRTATFLKGQYEKKTGLPATFKVDAYKPEEGVHGNFQAFLEQVIHDIDEDWIKTLDNRARDFFT
jgi:hypothetical protein